jgi:hypothetical protein
MTEKRLAIHDAASALDRAQRRRAESDRPDAPAEFTPGGPAYRILWCRVTAGAPGDPPDERYYAEAVRPSGLDAAGRVRWEAVPGGPTDLVVHNLAEAADGTHLLPDGTILRVEARLDGDAPPEMVYLTTYATAAAERIARIVSWDDGTYTVQPVVRQGGAFVDEGDPVAGVPNVGELWSEEAGYLAGPPAYERYVRLVRAGEDWLIVHHPPRMV